MQSLDEALIAAIKFGSKSTPDKYPGWTWILIIHLKICDNMDNVRIHPPPSKTQCHLQYLQTMGSTCNFHSFDKQKPGEAEQPVETCHPLLLRSCLPPATQVCDLLRDSTAITRLSTRWFSFSPFQHFPEDSGMYMSVSPFILIFISFCQNFLYVDFVLYISG